ncbi:alpha/beta hydrolase [Chelatococcus sp. SYSU_G07232]|uniref:Alpha/beta hydrolase n=1 Tax=Chelatococcus albus TaxID=3047466 RepID=A0ABT7AJ48_9HYPH|nr:alpha/beta hydrolase [Chelatococcus sp. SYSU_G07232]MDJ1159130.1 alpha/beta hydrolase [Chelatococcus sp. SYSU_G07232]
MNRPVVATLGQEQADAAPAGGAVDGEARARALYDLERTTVFACRRDPRFSYCLYVPPAVGRGGEAPELVVAMHGTGRTFTAYRDAMAEFGRWNNCIVLAPLFPVGVLGDGNRNGYKYMQEGDIRYDRVLLAMVEEVGERYGCAFERFALFGYSGGGHFTHRFLILHPERLWAASVGAPGSVTLLDPERDWWVGVRNIGALFGRDLDLAAMRQVPVQMVVGAADLETWEITHQPGGRHWMEGANDAGRTRPERLASLRRSFEAAGIPVRFDLVPNTAHDGQRCLAPVKDFFAAVLRERRAAARQA